MSNPRNEPMDISNCDEQMKSTDVVSKSDSSDGSVKRCLFEITDEAIKKMKIETPTLTRKLLTTSTTNATEPKFVSASSLVETIPEMSDEEILKYTIKFEREHGL